MGRYDVVSLEDLRPITPTEHEAARAVVRQVQDLLRRRDLAVAAGELDPAIDLPAGNWHRELAANDFMDAHQLVARAGYDTINHLRYYTNAFTGYKLIHFRPGEGLHSVMPLPADVRAAVTRNLRNEQPLVDYYLRLKRRLPPRLLIRPPALLGEVGRLVDGVIVNQDTIRFQSIVATLWHIGVLAFLERQLARHGNAYIVEIGPGHAALAYHLKRILPGVTYVGIDIPENLLFSGIYLSLTIPDHKVGMLGPDGPGVTAGGLMLAPNFLCREVLALLPRVDVALNFASFGEMTDEQVAFYARTLSNAMPGGLLFETNAGVGPRSTTAAAKPILAAHFKHHLAVDWTGIPQFSGTSHLYANRPWESLLSLNSSRRLLAAPLASGWRAKAGRLVRGLRKLAYL